MPRAGEGSRHSCSITPTSSSRTSFSIPHPLLRHSPTSSSLNFPYRPPTSATCPQQAVIRCCYSQADLAFSCTLNVGGCCDHGSMTGISDTLHEVRSRLLGTL